MAKNRRETDRAKIGRLFGLIFLFAAVFFGWRYYRHGTIIDKSGLCGRLEATIDDILARDGVRDVDIGRTLQTERRQALPVPTSWIETEREIRVQPGISVRKIVDEIKKAADDQYQLEPLTDEFRNGRVVLEIGQGRRIFQRLLFISGAGVRRDVRGAQRTGLVAIVIDDVAGRRTDLDKLDDFFSLDIPLTYAILPHENLTRDAAEKIHRAGDEIILHQPMEPEDIAHNDPGKAAVLNAMTPSQIRGKIEACFDDVPYAVGVSNHMGSRFTSDPRAMKALLEALKGMKSRYGGEPIFFFDSHTTQKPVSAGIARRIGLERLQNDLFLDNKDDPEAMAREFEVLERRVKARGWGAAIGHIQRRYMVDALRRAIEQFHSDGIQFVHLSDLIEAGAGRGGLRPAKRKKP